MVIAGAITCRESSTWLYLKVIFSSQQDNIEGFAKAWGQIVTGVKHLWPTVMTD